MMSIRSFLGGFLIIAGCATAMVVVTALVISMQLDTGSGLLIGVGGLLGAALALALGFLVLIQRS